MQVENVEMAIRRALGLIQINKKTCHICVCKEKNSRIIRLGFSWWRLGNVKRILTKRNSRQLTTVCKHSIPRTIVP